MRELEMHWFLAAHSAQAKSNTMDWMASMSGTAYSKDSDGQGLQDEAGQGSLYSRAVPPPTNTQDRSQQQGLYAKPSESWLGNKNYFQSGEIN